VTVLTLHYYKIFAVSQVATIEQYSELNKHDLGDKNENSVLSHTLQPDPQYFQDELF